MAIDVSGNFNKIFYEKGLLEINSKNESDITERGRIYYSVCVSSYGMKAMGENHSNSEIFEFLMSIDLLNMNDDIVQMTNKGVLFVFEDLKFNEEAFKRAKMFLEQNNKSKLYKILD